jgi:NDP-sugar pyrophosphorylase family protein
MLPIAVLCGGRGTRLRAVTHDAQPKAMVEVGGRPFIDWKLLELRRLGFSEVVLLTGFLGDEIRAHVGDGSSFGLAVHVVDDGAEPLGTGGAVLAAGAVLPDRFWITYGDTLLDVPAAEVEERFAAHDWSAIMSVLHNRGEIEASNALVAGDRVLAYGKDPRPHGAEHIDYGMLIVQRRLFEPIPSSRAFDLADVLTQAASRDDLGAFEVDRRFYEMGTPDSLAEVLEFVVRSAAPTESS